MIHVIGDSHVSVFTGLHGVCPAFPDSTPHALDSFRVWHLGPFLAYSVDKPTHRVCRLALQCLKHVPMKSQIAFFMGEIDCRNHILKHGSSRRTIVQNAKKVATRYVRAVDELSRSRKPVKLAVVALPPATEAQHGNEQQPSVGTRAQRTVAVAAFNAGLRAAAKSCGMQVFEAIASLGDEQGRPLGAYFADGVHADPRCLPVVVQELRQKGWLDMHGHDLAVAQALACIAPPTRHSLPCGLGDLRTARLVLAERAALRCRAAGAKTAAVYGAGRHTHDLGLACFTRAGLRVVALLDDSPAVDTLHGVRVMRPDAVRARFDAVIISSDGHESTLLQSAKRRFGSSKLIMPIYTQPE